MGTYSFIRSVVNNNIARPDLLIIDWLNRIICGNEFNPKFTIQINISKNCWSTEIVFWGYGSSASYKIFFYVINVKINYVFVNINSRMYFVYYQFEVSTSTYWGNCKPSY